MGKYKNSISFEEGFVKIFDTEEKLKSFLEVSFEEYVKDGDFEAFYYSLELVIKARGTISNFAKSIDLSRSGLYNIINGKKEPKFTTLVKILNELGYTLKIA